MGVLVELIAPLPVRLNALQVVPNCLDILLEPSRVFGILRVFCLLFQPFTQPTVGRLIALGPQATFKSRAHLGGKPALQEGVPGYVTGPGNVRIAAEYLFTRASIRACVDVVLAGAPHATHRKCDREVLP